LNRQLPAGGIVELQQAVLKEKAEWVDKQDRFHRIIPTSQLVNRYLSWFFASAYSFAPQGRVSGFQSCPLSDAPSLAGAILVEDFKTSDKFGYQPLLIPDWLRPYLGIWIDHIRPQVVAALSDSAQRINLMDPSAFLFIKANGSQADISQLLIAWFREHLDLHLTRYLAYFQLISFHLLLYDSNPDCCCDEYHYLKLVMESEHYLRRQLKLYFVLAK